MEKESYDKSRMQHKEGILRFEFGDFPAIGIDHFEDRRDERTKISGTNIFDETGLDDETVLRRCFEILENEKYEFIIESIEENKPKHTEFIVGFETDEDSDDGFLFVFVVFSISIKETAMNGIEQGQEFLSCITVVKDTYKRKRKLPADTVEVVLSYKRDDFGVEYFWENGIPR